MKPGDGTQDPASLGDDFGSADDEAAFAAALDDTERRPADNTDDGSELVPFEPNRGRRNRQRHANPDLPRIDESDVSRWIGIEPPPLVFTISELVPEAMCTLLVGEGGAGKSILLQTACTCIPSGLPFIGKDTIRGAAAGVFAEDGEGILHLRQQRINDTLRMDMNALAGRAFIRSYAGLDATLWNDGGPTNFFGQLEQQLSSIGDLRLVALDNCALLFAGNENDRRDVTVFLNALNGLAHRLKVAVILSTHVSKSTDDTTIRAASGSTAWINASRSTIKLVPGQNKEPPVLRLLKANHAKSGGEIPLEWRDGVLVAATQPGSFEQRVRDRQLDRFIFTETEKAWAADYPLSPSPQTGDRYLPKHISRKGEFRAAEAKTAMLALMDGDFLAVDQRTTRTPKGLRVARWPDWRAETQTEEM